MSETGFRDLFIELPRAVFDALRAIGEGAVAKAGGVADMSGMAPAVKAAYAYQPPLWASAWLWGRLAARYGAEAVEMRRYPQQLMVEMAIRPRCGHPAYSAIDERSLHVAPMSDLLDVIDEAYDRAERGCYCMARSWHA